MQVSLHPLFHKQYYLFTFLLPSVCFCRYNLPVVIIVVNNNGIYSGVDPDTWKEMAKMGDLASM